MPRWHHANHPHTLACESCVYQAAGAFDKDPDIEWTWQNKPTGK